MLILGQKHRFATFEIELLSKKFKKINQINYKDNNADEVLENIKNCLGIDQFKIIVLNTKATVDDKIVKFLTNLKFNDKYRNIEIISVEYFLEKYLNKCYIPGDNTDLHYLGVIRQFSRFQYFQKRIIDYFGIFWLFLFSFFVMQKCKRKIKEESPGSVYFRQKRVGFNNVEFECIKFRSMHENTEFFNHYTQKNDPRIFPWGEVMRRRRYDELPQMINILRGEMHIIGPRAEWNELVKSYEKKIPYYNQRHIVRPGITGWAQVNYPYGANIEDTKQKLMYDLYYIKHWSFLLDLKIVYKTAMVVLHKKGI